MEGPHLAGALQARLSALHQELHSHMRLVATVLDRADREHSSIRKVHWMSSSRACFAEVGGVCFGNLRMSEVRRGVECGCAAFQLWELGLPLSRCGPQSLLHARAGLKGQTPGRKLNADPVNSGGHRKWGSRGLGTQKRFTASRAFCISESGILTRKPST